MDYPQPGIAWEKAKFDDEIRSGSGDVANDDVYTELPYGAHPRDDSRKRVVRVDEERFYPTRKLDVRSASQDSVCDSQIDQHIGRGQVVLVLAVYEEDAWGDFAG
jgi:hypothetical protein